MNIKSFSILLSCSLLLSSCFILEKEVTMRKFNHKVKTENYKLPNIIEVNLVYNPKINFEITKKTLFLKKIDSAFVDNFKNNLIEKMLNCNIKCIENSSSKVTISIDNIKFLEDLVNRSYDDDGEDVFTLENRVIMRIEYTVHKNDSDKGKKLKNYIYNETVTNKNLFLGIEIEKNNTFELGMAEENLLQIAANNCAMYLNEDKKK